MKVYYVDGTRLVLEKTSEGFVVLGGRPRRVLVSITQEKVDKLRPSGLIGIAWRYGLNTPIGKAYRLLANVLRQNPDGTWTIYS